LSAGRRFWFRDCVPPPPGGSVDPLAPVLAAHQQWLDGEPGGQRADLRDATLDRHRLAYANLRGADLTGAHLWHSDLRMADLRDADLRGADLTGADLTLADLRGAQLGGANLEGATVQWVTFDAHVVYWDLGLVRALVWADGRTELRAPRFYGSLTALAATPASAWRRHEYAVAVAMIRAGAATRWPGWTERDDEHLVEEVSE